MRYLVAFISVLAAIAVAAAEFHFAAPPDLKKDSPEESAFVFDLCVTFYAAAYVTGRLAYALLGRSTEHNELRRWSGWHMLVLHCFAFVITVVPIWSASKSLPLLRPATIVTAVLVIVSAAERSRTVTSRSEPPHR